MSEGDVPAKGSSTAPADGSRAAGPISFGAQLAQARERAGLSVGDVANRLRLHPNQVRALEAGQLSALPEAAYVRGFIRSYARIVGIDSAPLVDDFNGKVVPVGDSVVDGMARTQDYSPVKAAAQEQVSRALVLGLAVAALVVLGVIGYYATRPDSTASGIPQKAAPAPQPAPRAVEAAPRPAPAAVPPAIVADATTERTVSDATAAPAEAAPATAALLTLSFNGVSWIEVTDARGKVLLSQLARAGEVHQPTGEPPLAVVVGDASKVTATVHGAPFDLEPVTRSNVARFSVK